MKAPTISELVEAVRERMEQATDRPIAGFEARVIRNVLAIVERELQMGPAVETQRSALLNDMGVEDDDALAAAIRSGELDERTDELRSGLLALAEAQLAIDNPRWLTT